MKFTWICLGALTIESFGEIYLHVDFMLFLFVVFVEDSTKTLVSELSRLWRYNHAISLLTCTRISVVQTDGASHSIACIVTLSHGMASMAQAHTERLFFKQGTHVHLSHQNSTFQPSL